ncbi:MAG: polyprenyl synthetase family protein [Leptospira sp.]|nr:polyprenyl synthetase family protein [Leptospira sp.]
MNDTFLSSISSTKHLFESFFESQIPIIFQPNSRITEACIYSLKAGGKRIRPIFVLQSFYRGKPFPQTFEESDFDLLLLALSIEFIHTYSLIHDDLPSMDNDDTRRGFPTCHIQFDEATAILAGDALNSLAFALIANISSRYTDNDRNLIRDLIQILHGGAGLGGMILGQNLDLLQEKQPINDPDLEKDLLLSIHAKKTGALIESSFLLGNRMREDNLLSSSLIQSYAKEIGLLFQITDDILDVEGSKDELGKTPGKDEKSGKLTYPSLFGMQTAKSLKNQSMEKAITLAKQLPSGEQFFFLELPKYIAERKS